MAEASPHLYEHMQESVAERAEGDPQASETVEKHLGEEI